MRKVIALYLAFSLLSLASAFCDGARFEMVIQNGHAKGVYGLAASGDGQYFATSSEDKTAKLWRASDGVLIRTFIGHSHTVRDVVFGANDTLITSSLDDSIKIWSMKDGACLKTIPVSIPNLWKIALSPDGATLAVSADSLSPIHLIRLGDGQVVGVFPEKSISCSALAFSPDGRRLYQAEGYYHEDHDNTVNVWDVASRTLSMTMKGHSEYLMCMDLSPDGRTLITGSWDQTIRIWDASSGRCVTTMGGSDFKAVDSVAISPDGRYFASSDRSPGLRVFRMSDFSPVCDTSKYGYPDLVFGRDDRLFTGYRIFDAKDLTVRQEMAIYGKPVMGMSLSRDGKSLIVSGGDAFLKIWELSDLAMTRNIKVSYADSLLRQALPLPGDKTIVTIASTKIQVWDRDSGVLVTELDRGENAPSTMALSPDGKTAAMGTNHGIGIWNTADWSLVREWRATEFVVNTLAFSPDGRFLVMGDMDNHVKVYRASDWELVQDLEEASNYFMGVAVSPRGDLLVSAAVGYDGDKLTIRSFPECELIERIGTSARNVAFSPDGRYFAVDEGFDITLWDAEKLVPTRTLRGHKNTINDLLFHPEGGLLFSASDDNTIRIWNLETGDSVCLLGLQTGDWMIYDDEGRFDCSRNAGDFVKMTSGLEAFGVDQFSLRNNRPDLILGKIGGRQDIVAHLFQQYQKRLRKSGFSESMLSADSHTPQAVITGTKQDGKTMQVSFTMSDTLYDLKSYGVFVNDIPLFGPYGKPIGGRSASVSEKVALTAGRNKIEISCLNDRGAESYRSMCYADYGAKVKGDLYFIGFGVSTYKDSAINLKYAAKDVADLARAFAQMKDQYLNLRIKTYTDQDVTIENIKKAKDFLRGAGVDDTFVLFISGHGLHDIDKEATYYYLTYAADLKNLAATAANFELVEELLQNVAPRNKLFLMDTCESGEVDADAQNEFLSLAGSKGIQARTTKGLMVAFKGNAATGPRSYLFQKDRFIYNDLSRRSGAIVFSSCRGGEFSYESDEVANGFFTRAIIDALKGKAAGDDGVVTTDLLRDYVSQRVAELSSGMQNPTVDRDNIYQKFGFAALR